MSQINPQILEHFTDDRIDNSNFTDDDLRGLRNFANALLQQNVQLRETLRNAETRTSALVTELSRLGENLKGPTKRQMAWDLVNSYMKNHGKPPTSSQIDAIISVFNQSYPPPIIK